MPHIRLWGLFHLTTGSLSDRWGRKGLIVAVMWFQAAALLLTALTRDFGWWLAAGPLLDFGTAMVYTSLIAAVSDASHTSSRAVAQRLPFLARPRLCDRGAIKQTSSALHGRSAL